MLNNNKNFLYVILIFIIVNFISIIIYLILVKKNIYEIELINDNNIEFILEKYSYNNDPKKRSSIIYINIDELKNNPIIKFFKDRNKCRNSLNNNIYEYYYYFLNSTFPSVEINNDNFVETVDINDYFNDPIDKVYRVTSVVDEFNFNIALYSKEKYYNDKYFNDVTEKIKNNILYYLKPKIIYKNYNDYINENYKDFLKRLEDSIFQRIFSEYKLNDPNPELSEIINFNFYKKLTDPSNSNHEFFLFLKNFHNYGNYSNQFFTKYSQYFNTCEKEILMFLNELNNYSLLNNNIQYNYDDEYNKFYNTIKTNTFKISNSFEINIFIIDIIIKFFVFHALISFLLLYLLREIWN